MARTPARARVWITQIIHVNLTAEAPVLVEEGAKLTFTYSVNWVPTKTPFHRRFERYLDYSFFEHKVRAPCRPWRRPLRTIAVATAAAAPASVVRDGSASTTGAGAAWQGGLLLSSS